MAYFLSDPAPGACSLTAKNRVWEFFANPNKSHPVNRRNPQQVRQKNRPTPTKTASGIPLWPSRDPIGERGGLNLYEFAGNKPISSIDYLGFSCSQVAGSFKWTTPPKITSIYLNFSSNDQPEIATGGNVLEFENANVVWHAYAQVDCCCSDGTTVAKKGYMVGSESVSVATTYLFYGSGSISTPFNGIKVGDLLSLVAVALGGKFSPPTGLIDKANSASDLLDEIVSLANLPTNWKWANGKTPCQ